jgi:hypothetical protein
MSITVGALHKVLSDLVSAGHSRKPVCIDKSTFSHVLESDGAVILPIEKISPVTWVPTVDDDGGTKMNADGSESGRYMVVLSG